MALAMPFRRALRPLLVTAVAAIEQDVASFVGQGYFVRGQMLTPDTVQTELGVIRGNRAYQWPTGSAVDVLLRPDDVIHDDTSSTRAKVLNKAFRGADILYTLELAGGTRVLSLVPSHHNHALG